jgi:NO-binding membrane sensor protein with MHYT domain
MDHAEHFAMGGWLLVLAFVTSVVGSTVGLACTLQSRNAATQGKRVGWLAMAALAIGGVGIWLMHFIAVLGFDTPGYPVRFDLARTALSAVLAVASVFVGLVVFGVQKKFVVWRLLVAGVITGLAVNLMHYSGMWALNIKGDISFNAGLVALSIVIAIVAGTAALWFTATVDKIQLRLVAAVVMGIAVTGMHYTGMSAVRVHIDPAAPDPTGVEVFSFLFPVFVLAAAALTLPIVAVLTSAPAEEEGIPLAAPPQRKELV